MAEEKTSEVSGIRGVRETMTLREFETHLTDALKKQNTKVNYSAMAFILAAALQLILGVTFIVSLKKDVEHNSEEIHEVRNEQDRRTSNVYTITKIEVELGYIKKALAEIQGELKDIKQTP
jgi:hypothetical protein